MSTLYPAANRAVATPTVRSRRARVLLWRAALYALAIAGAAIFVIPLVWMILTALKTHQEVYTFPPQLLPHGLRWSNFHDAWTTFDFTHYTVNTVIITGLTIAGTLATSSLCAFGFARLRFAGNNVIFLCVLASVMLPQQVTLIPLYIIFKQLHWLDSFLPLVVPPWFGGGALNIFLLRQFFKTLPRELDEAARIDGCSTFGIFWRIALPLAKPALAVVAIFQFNATWTDFLGPLIYLNSPDNFTLALGVYSFQSQMLTGVSHEELMMAVALVMVAPIALVFLFAQRYMVRGVVLSGLKG